MQEELSTHSADDGDPEGFVPLMKLGRCLFVSVPAMMKDSQARNLEEAIGKRLSREQGIRGLIIDVSALLIVDSFVAKVLADSASIAQSFGASAVLVGMRPAVAVTLVELGINLGGVQTALTLERALEKLKIKIVAED